MGFTCTRCEFAFPSSLTDLSLRIIYFPWDVQIVSGLRTNEGTGLDPTSWAECHPWRLPSCGLKTFCPLVIHSQSSQWGQAEAPPRGLASCSRESSSCLHSTSEHLFKSLLFS